ncbi:MAG: hypothetical protein JJT94_07050 [Bernardetiaceae bacterium]|nr:hypothetical protein [Bernardetiaceae bacterium]
MKHLVFSFVKDKEEQLTVLGLILSFLLLLVLMFFSAEQLASKPSDDSKRNFSNVKYQHNIVIPFFFDSIQGKNKAS